jgi:hypothetical protein
MKLIKCDILAQYVACGILFAEKCKQKFVAEIGVKINRGYNGGFSLIAPSK